MSAMDIHMENFIDNDESVKVLITQHENFILNCASSAAGKYISKSDDEWFVALAAFIEASKNYSQEKGSFANYTELVIRKQIAECIKSKSRYAPEMLTKPILVEFEGEGSNIKLEVYLINDILSVYGFSFMDLIDCSPKSGRAKRACTRVVSYMINHPILVREMKIKRQLPLNLIHKNAKASRKILERHLKYIIATVEIMTGEFPCIASYMGYICKELNK